MEITTGKGIHKSVIKGLLKPIPRRYLKVKKIIVSIVPSKEIKKRNYRWGGLWGHVEIKTKEIDVYLYPIAEAVNREFRIPKNNNNWYHTAIKILAETLYWGVASVYLKGSNTKQRGLLETKFMELARDEGVLDVIPGFKKIRFFKIWRDKEIDWIMSIIRKSEEFTFSHIDHLRKCKIGLQYKYNTRQLFNSLFPNAEEDIRKYVTQLIRKQHLNDSVKEELISQGGIRSRRKSLLEFKGKVLKIIKKPKCYKSKAGLNYAYFTEKNLKKLQNKLEWAPKTEYNPYEGMF